MLSCVIPAFNEQDCIERAIREVARVLSPLTRRYEIIVVDDGSRDSTVMIAEKLITEFPLRILCLSRNFGKENALRAGIEAARGDAVIVIDADLQEPADNIKTLVAKWQEGYDMVYGFRANRDDEGLRKRLGTWIFYKLMRNAHEVTVPADARDFRLMDRKVVDAICSLPERNLFMKGMYSWVGFKSTSVPIFMEERRGGVTKYGFRRLFDLAVTGLTAFTVWPLRIWVGLGTIISILSITYAGYVALRTLIYGTDVPGWATLTVAMFFFGGVQLLSIGILGEYLSRVYTEVKGRPRHIIAREIVSPIVDSKGVEGESLAQPDYKLADTKVVAHL